MISQGINSNREERQSFVETTTKFIMTKVSSAAKLFLIYSVDWGRYFNLINKNSQTAHNIRFTGNIVKLTSAGLFELPEKFRNIGNAFKNFAHQRTKEAAKKALLALNDAVNPAVDSVELLQTAKIANVSEAHLTLLKKFNGVSMLIGFGNMTKESLLKYWEARRTVVNSPVKQHYLEIEKRKQMFECAKAVSYFVLGLLICASLFLGIVAPGVAFSTAATSALVFTILGFYNDEWGQAPALKRNWMALATAHAA
jgi:multisubunit Na+/H+ antiporter MnhB subunit